MVNFGWLAAEIISLVWGTPGNFNGFRILAALLHGTLVVGVSQTAALNRGRHLYLAGRPSRWALAHISSSLFFWLPLKYLGNGWTDVRQIHSEDVFNPSLARVGMSRSKVTRDKKRKTAESSPLTMHCKASAVRRTRWKWRHVAVDGTILSPPGVTGWRSARWRRRACGFCLVKHL